MTSATLTMEAEALSLREKQNLMLFSILDAQKFATSY